MATPRPPSPPDKTSDKSASSGSTSKAPANETTKPVEGRAYADILTGSRNGLYLNTSGNVRDGQVFSLVKREGREYHIYGTGKDRLIVGLRAEDGDDAGDAVDDRQDDDHPEHAGAPARPAAGAITDSATTGWN